MRFRDILLEYEREQSMKRWAIPLRAKIVADPSIANEEIAAWITDPRRYYRAAAQHESGGRDLPEGVPEILAKCDGRIAHFFEVNDPTFLTTKQLPYVTWMIQRYCNGGIQRLEDVISKAKPWLEAYHRLKVTGWFRRNPEYALYADIGRFKGLGDLGDFMMPIMAQETESETAKRKVEDARVMKEEVEILLDNETLRVAIPRTEAAAILLGRNTQWCTAAEKSNYFESYNKRGDLYVVLDKKTNRRWQLHFGDCQFMDERDEPIVWESFPMAAFDAIDLENLPLKVKWGAMRDEIEGDQLPQAIEKRILAGVDRSFLAGLMVVSADYPEQVEFLASATNHKISEGKSVTLRENIHTVDFGSDFLSFLVNGMRPTGLTTHRASVRKAFGLEDLSVIVIGNEYEQFDRALHRNTRFMSVLTGDTHAHVIIRSSPYDGWVIEVLSQGRLRGYNRYLVKDIPAIRDRSEIPRSDLEYAIVKLCHDAAIY